MVRRTFSLADSERGPPLGRLMAGRVVRSVLLVGLELDGILCALTNEVPDYYRPTTIALFDR